MSRLDGIPTRFVKVPGYTGPDRRASHASSVAGPALAMEGNDAADALTTAGNSQGDRLTARDLEAAYARAIDAAGLDDKGFAAVAGISAGQLSRQLRGVDGHHLSVQRLECLSRDGQAEFVAQCARRLGLDVVQPAAEALIVSELMDVCLRAMRHMRMLRMDVVTRRQPAADRRVG